MFSIVLGISETAVFSANRFVGVLFCLIPSRLAASPCAALCRPAHGVFELLIRQIVVDILDKLKYITADVVYKSALQRGAAKKQVASRQGRVRQSRRGERFRTVKHRCVVFTNILPTDHEGRDRKTGTRRSTSLLVVCCTRVCVSGHSVRVCTFYAFAHSAHSVRLYLARFVRVLPPHVSRLTRHISYVLKICSYCSR